MKKRAIITGIFGQDGSYMAECLYSRGYELIGIPNPRSFERDQPRIAEFEEKYPGSKIYYIDLANEEKKFAALLTDENTRPVEIYNFAGVSDVFNPYSDMANLVDLNCKIPAMILENISRYDKTIKFVQASSVLAYCGENNFPEYPYGLSKFFIDQLMNKYRDQFSMTCYSLILSTHASERTNERFFMRKLSMGIAKLKLGLINTLILGDLSVARDIGYTPQYMALCCGLVHSTNSSASVFINTGKEVLLEDIVKAGCDHAGVSMDSIMTSKDHSRPYNRPLNTPATKWPFVEPALPTEFIKNMIDHDIKLLKPAP